MGVPENLDALMAKYDLNASAIARIAGVSEAAVSDWRNRNKGVTPRRANLEPLCRRFNLTYDDILSEENGLAAKEHGAIDGYTSVPLLGSIAAGEPIDMESAEGSFPVPSKMHSRYPDAFLLRVEGDSMNRRVPDGCLVLVDPDDRRPDGRGAFAVCVNGCSATVKRVRRLANGYELIPDSYDVTQRPLVFDYGVDGTQEVTVIGRVVWATMPFDYEI